jgi:hypothetical protein
MAGSLSMATTAVSSEKVAVADSGEVGRSAVYSRYNNGPRTLPCGTPALRDDSSVYSVSTFTRKTVFQWTLCSRRGAQYMSAACFH